MKFLDIAKALNKLPLFNQVDNTHLQKIATLAMVRNIKKGQTFIYAGDKPDGFYQVLEGRVKLLMLSADGEEKIIEVIDKDHCFGEAVVFSEKPYPVNAQAIVASEVLFIPKTILFELIDNDKLFVKKMLSGMSFRLHLLFKEIENVSFRDSTSRVADYLLSNSDFPINCEHGIDVEKKKAVTLTISKRILARKLSITPETLSRVFANLSSLGYIEVNKNTINIKNQKALMQLDTVG